MSILIRNAVLRGKTRDIYIEEGRIQEIGSLSLEADEVIDARDMAIMPGFINTHTHAAMTLFRGWGDDMELMEWLTNRIWPKEARLNEELVYWGTKLACLEMIRSGTTTFMDMYFYPESAAKAAQETGIRGFIGAVFIGLITGKGDEESIREAKGTLRSLRGFGELIRPTLAPHAIYSCTEEILKWTAHYSKEQEIPVHFHLLETERERMDFLKKRGSGVIEYLEEIGFLQPRLVAAHCVWANETDARILGKHGVNVSFNPVSNMKLAVGKVMNVEMMERMGVNVCLGTDGPASNNSLSMLDTMKFGGLSAKSYYTSPTLCDADTLIAYSTINGAKALSLDCGIVEEGKLADVMLIDLKHESMLPRRHPLNSKLAYSASPEAIKHVICNGKLIMRDRIVKDSEEIKEGFEEAVNKLFDGSFC